MGYFGFLVGGSLPVKARDARKVRRLVSKQMDKYAVRPRSTVHYPLERADKLRLVYQVLKWLPSPKAVPQVRAVSQSAVTHRVSRT